MSLLTGNTFIDLIAIFVSLFAVVYGYFQWNYRYWWRKNVPYLKPTFPFGNRHIVGKAVSLRDDIFNLTKEGREKGWKYFGIFLGLDAFLVLYDLELIKNVLVKDFNYFTERGLYYNEKDDPISAHLLNIGGTKWKNLRAKLTPAFSSGKIKGMFQTLLNCCSGFEEALKTHHNTMEPIDIKNALACFTTDVIGSCALGIECNSFKDPDAPFVKYGEKIFFRNSFERVLDLFAQSFPNVAHALHIKSIPEDVSNFFSDVVTKTISHRESSKSTRNDFLQLLIDMRNNNEGFGETFSIKEIIAQCFAFFLAGFETSSTTVTFALFELSQHLDIQEKIRQELFTVLKKYDNKICYEALKDLEYMQQVLDESLRKYPPAVFVTRRSVQNYKPPNTDLTLEKGTNIIVPIIHLHHDENIYPDPEKFDPDRFSPEQRNGRSPFHHMPFGEGPRTCIGMRFGLIQSKVALATVLSNFRVKLNPRTKTPLEMDPQTIVPTTIEGIWLDLEKIN